MMIIMIVDSGRARKSCAKSSRVPNRLDSLGLQTTQLAVLLISLGVPAYFCVVYISSPHSSGCSLHMTPTASPQRPTSALKSPKDCTSVFLIKNLAPFNWESGTINWNLETHSFRKPMSWPLAKHFSSTEPWDLNHEIINGQDDRMLSCWFGGFPLPLWCAHESWCSSNNKLLLAESCDLPQGRVDDLQVPSDDAIQH